MVRFHEKTDTLGMRIVIQKPTSKEYYLGHGQWTEQRDHAATFSDASEAFQECAKVKLHSHIVLSFRDSRYDLHLPLVQA